MTNTWLQPWIPLWAFSYVWATVLGKLLHTFSKAKHKNQNGGSQLWRPSRNSYPGSSYYRPKVYMWHICIFSPPPLTISRFFAYPRLKSLLLDTFSLRSSQMVPNYFLFPYKYPEFHLRKICPQFWANRHFPNGDGHDGGLYTNWEIKALPMAWNRQSSSWAEILLLLTHSLTHSNR